MQRTGEQFNYNLSLWKKTTTRHRVLNILLNVWQIVLSQLGKNTCRNTLIHHRPICVIGLLCCWLSQQASSIRGGGSGFRMPWRKYTPYITYFFKFIHGVLSRSASLHSFSLVMLYGRKAVVFLFAYKMTKEKNWLKLPWFAHTACAWWHAVSRISLSKRFVWAFSYNSSWCNVRWHRDILDKEVHLSFTELFLGFRDVFWNNTTVRTVPG